MKAIVSEKGQITIPKSVRDRLGIVPGTVLEIESDAGRLIGTKRESGDAIEKWRGTVRLPEGLCTDAYIEKTRG